MVYFSAKFGLIFADPRGRRVLFGWVGAPHLAGKFTGAQSIGRMIVADPGGPLRFLPLPELTSLHTNSKTFAHDSSATVADDSSVVLLVENSSNSYHLNATFDVSALAKHSRAPCTASISLGVYLLHSTCIGNQSQQITPDLIPRPKPSSSNSLT